MALFSHKNILDQPNNWDWTNHQTLGHKEAEPISDFGRQKSKANQLQ
jgi:hypothetical protein